MCGGPSHEQKQAAAEQTKLSEAELAEYRKYAGAVDPFYMRVMGTGLPYFAQESQYSTSNLARQINRARAMMRGRLAGYGSALPSGFADQSERDLEASGANYFDQNILDLLRENFAARFGAAEAMNPQAPAGSALQGFASVMNAPLQNTFWPNVIGGLVQGGARVGAAAVCWIGEVLYGRADPRTRHIRKWLGVGPMASRWRAFALLYRMFGRRVAEHARFSSRVRSCLRPLFDRAWRQARFELEES